jgi:hypothetical protein
VPACSRDGRQNVCVAADDPLLQPIDGAQSSETNGVRVDVVPAGEARVKRVVYPAGYRWSTHIKPAVGTERCMHAHVGFLVRGRMAGEYADGCTFEFAAPAAVVVEPGHDAWTVGDEDAVYVEVDFEADSAARFGLPAEHEH